MSSYLDKTGLERVWSKATDKFATIATTDELKGNIETLTSTKADKTEVETAVAGLVDSAPETLNTLNELAAALGDDPNFATTIATEVGKKVNSSEYNDAIAGINANIASITPEKIGALNKEEYLGPVVLEGNPIVYESGTEGLGIAAVSYLEPKQEGSGDPYPAGGGKNKLVPPSKNEAASNVWADYSFNNDTGAYKLTKSVEPSLWAQFIQTFDATVLAGKNVVLSYKDYTITSAGHHPRVYILDIDGATAYGNIFFEENNNKETTFAIPAGVTSLILLIRIDQEKYAPKGTVLTINGLQLEIGTVATEFTPPSNIRPIVGYDALNLNASGKNLLNNIRYYDSTHTDIRAQYDSPLLLKAGVTYTLSTNIKADGLFFVDAAGNGSLDAQYLLNYQYQTASLEYTPTRDIECIFVAIFNSGVPVGTTIQLEVGSATAYEPYQGKAYTVQIGQTVYGGRMDWLTGKMLVGWAGYSLTSEKGVSLATSKGNELFYYDFDNMPSTIKGQGTLGFACSHYTVGNILWNDVTMRNKVINTHDNKFQPGFAFALGTYGSIDAWNAFVDAQNAAGTPIQLVWPLATPIEIQLTPIQISELSGINTLYGDGNIRAIFNTTGSASPVLESISGILPVEKGGTGASSAAAARSNLGITPANIGAAISRNEYAASLDALLQTGIYHVSNQNGVRHNYGQVIVCRGGNTGDTIAQISIPYDNSGLPSIRYGNPSSVGGKGDWLGWYDFLTTKAAVTIGQGGTGATDAATARSNLGITPANIGAAPTSHASTATTYGAASASNYGHAMASSTTPKANGTAAVGSETAKFARGDHVHPLQTSVTGSSGSCTGNAASASKIAITDTTPTSGTTYYPLYVTSRSGNQTVRANEHFYYYDVGTESYICVGGTSQLGGITLRQTNGYYINIIPASLTAVRNIYLPDVNGTVLTTGNLSYTDGASSTGTIGTLKINSNSYTLKERLLNGTGTSFSDASITDLNNVKTPSVYYAGASSISKILTNAPWTSSGFRLTTFAGYGGDSSYGLQVAVASSMIFWRNMGAANAEPSSWYVVPQIPYTGNNVGSSTTPIYMSSNGKMNACTSPSLLVNLGSTSAASVFAASPRPGITGTLGIGNGGTGATTAADARSKLGITPANIGALSSQGGTLTGSTLINGGSDWVGYRISRTANNIACNSDYAISGTGCAEMTLKQAGSTVNYVSLQPNATVLGKPLAIGSGGTGAVSKSGARTNLGITSGTSLPSSASAGDIFFLYS